MNTPGKLRAHRVLAVLMVAVGLALMAYMVTVEGEPGAIPALLVALGTGWYLVTRVRARSRHE